MALQFVMLRLRLTPRQLGLARSRCGRFRVLPKPQIRQSCSKPLSAEELKKLLSQPSWSVNSLRDRHNRSKSEERVTQRQLHHLLRLSALPMPKTAEEERKMIETLVSQLHFVQTILNVDTEGVAPMAAIRDETKAAVENDTITIDTLHKDLDREENVGVLRRIHRKGTSANATSPSLDEWNPLDSAPSAQGRYISIRNGGPPLG